MLTKNWLYKYSQGITSHYAGVPWSHVKQEKQVFPSDTEIKRPVMDEVFLSKDNPDSQNWVFGRLLKILRVEFLQQSTCPAKL